MKIENVLRGEIQKVLGTLGVVTGDFVVEYPADEKNGDFSTNVAMVAWKELGFENPKELGEVIVQGLKKSDILGEVVNLEQIVFVNGFVNFWLKSGVLIKELEEVISKGEKYGSRNLGKGQTWLLEHTSPNPNKAMHLGHLRNNVTGMAIGNIWEFENIKVVRDCIDNDRGISIARLMWGYLKFARKDKREMVDLHYWFTHKDEWWTPKEVSKRPDRFVDELYVKASEDFRNNKETEERVKKMVIDWENKDEESWALWEQVMEYSHQGQDMTLKRLKSRWDWVWHEHEHYQQGKQIAEEGLKKGVFVRSEGAVVTNLGKYNLPDTVVIKSDGTALYITQDLALTKLKKERFEPEKLFWVIGPEQSLQLKQLFAVCEQLGMGRVEDFTHIPYGWMSIKGSGKMGSRFGNVVFIDELIDQAKEVIRGKVEKSKFVSDEEMEEVIEKIAVGAIKYSILRVGRMTNTVFDFSTSLTFDGDSGPYLQYTYARANSVMTKARGEGGASDNPAEVEERRLMVWVARFPEVVEMAAFDFAPNDVATYVVELASRFNAFYNKHQIIGSEKEGFRLLLTKAVAQVIKNSLFLLGIETVDKM